MLVLTRKVGEEIVIGDCIRVLVTAVQGNKVRIGITAPPAIRVDRAEVHQRHQEFAQTDASEQPALEPAGNL